MIKIAAIPTVYDGIRFRSRLEARWAVFMDCLNVKWEYEPEAYGNGKIGYLPDFWLPQLDCFLEIKPIAPSDEEIEKAEILENGTGKPLYFMIGRPIEPDSISEEWMANGGGRPCDYPHYWFTCDFCKDVRIIYQYASYQCDCCENGHRSILSSMRKAIFCANNFRFEEGPYSDWVLLVHATKLKAALYKKCRLAEESGDTKKLAELLQSILSTAKFIDGLGLYNQ